MKKIVFMIFIIISLFLFSCSNNNAIVNDDNINNNDNKLVINENVEILGIGISLGAIYGYVHEYTPSDELFEEVCVACYRDLKDEDFIIYGEYEELPVTGLGATDGFVCVIIRYKMKNSDEELFTDYYISEDGRANIFKDYKKYHTIENIFDFEKICYYYWLKKDALVTR